VKPTAVGVNYAYDINVSENKEFLHSLANLRDADGVPTAPDYTAQCGDTRNFDLA
jgi:hypothetical protein